MTQKFADAARAKLAGDISATDTSFTIDANGALFPVADQGTTATGDWFKAVFQDSDGREIVYVRTHVSGTTAFSNVLRGQEGTTARAFAADSVVGLRVTAQDFTTMQQGGAFDTSKTANFTANVGSKYWLGGSVTVTLPDSTSLPIGSMVTFAKARAATPTIQVGAGAATISTAKGSDTAVVYDVDAEITLFYNGTDWEL